MADPDTLIKAKIHYYCRERQFHAMQFAAVEGMKRFSGDPAFKFFYGMALVLEGQLQVLDFLFSTRIHTELMIIQGRDQRVGFSAELF